MEEFEFWNELHLAYPQNAWLCFVAADARWYVDIPECLRMFMEAFELDNSLINAGVDGGVVNAIVNSEHLLRYELIVLADAKRADEEAYWEILAELREEWAGNEEALQAISAVAEDV